MWQRPRSGQPPKAAPKSSAAYCTGCGRLKVECNGCRRELDPPRFCPLCGRRLTVRVTPASVVARCRDHGVVSAD